MQYICNICAMWIQIPLKKLLKNKRLKHFKSLSKWELRVLLNGQTKYFIEGHVDITLNTHARNRDTTNNTASNTVMKWRNCYTHKYMCNIYVSCKGTSSCKFENIESCVHWSVICYTWLRQQASDQSWSIANTIGVWLRNQAQFALGLRSLRSRPCKSAHEPVASYWS